MLALVSFPFLVEPNLATRAPAYTWSGGYAALVLVCAYTAWASRHEAVVSEPGTIPEPIGQIEIDSSSESNESSVAAQRPMPSGQPRLWDL